MLLWREMSLKWVRLADQHIAIRLLTPYVSAAYQQIRSNAEVEIVTWALTTVVNTLNPEAFLRLLIGAILEHQIVLICKSKEVRAAVGFALVALLPGPPHSSGWMHTFLPLLPQV